MRAVDTNLVVRYIVAHDDPDQAKIAKALIDGESVFVPTTVLLESEWVLRSVYKVAKSALTFALRSFVGLPTVTLEQPDQVMTALNWLEDGLDFADALHVASARRCEAFVTFDKALAKSANALAGARVVLA